MMGTNWRNMSIEEKRQYIDKAEKIRKEKKDELDKIFSQLSQEKGNKIKQDIIESAAQKRKKLAKTRIKRVKYIYFINNPF
jgi:hypothetical protein